MKFKTKNKTMSGFTNPTSTPNPLNYHFTLNDSISPYHFNLNDSISPYHFNDSINRNGSTTKFVSPSTCSEFRAGDIQNPLFHAFHFMLLISFSFPSFHPSLSSKGHLIVRSLLTISYFIAITWTLYTTNQTLDHPSNDVDQNQIIFSSSFDPLNINLSGVHFSTTTTISIESSVLSNEDQKMKEPKDGENEMSQPSRSGLQSKEEENVLSEEEEKKVLSGEEKKVVSEDDGGKFVSKEGEKKILFEGGEKRLSSKEEEEKRWSSKERGEKISSSKKKRLLSLPSSSTRSETRSVDTMIIPLMKRIKMEENAVIRRARRKRERVEKEERKKDEGEKDRKEEEERRKEIGIIKKEEVNGKSSESRRKEESKIERETIESHFSSLHLPSIQSAVKILPPSSTVLEPSPTVLTTSPTVLPSFSLPSSPSTSSLLLPEEMSKIRENQRLRKEKEKNDDNNNPEDSLVNLALIEGEGRRIVSIKEENQRKMEEENQRKRKNHENLVGKEDEEITQIDDRKIEKPNGDNFTPSSSSTPFLCSSSSQFSSLQSSPTSSPSSSSSSLSSSSSSSSSSSDMTASFYQKFLSPSSSSSFPSHSSNRTASFSISSNSDFFPSNTSSSSISSSSISSSSISSSSISSSTASSTSFSSPISYSSSSLRNKSGRIASRANDEQRSKLREGKNLIKEKGEIREKEREIEEKEREIEEKEEGADFLRKALSFSSRVNLPSNQKGIDEPFLISRSDQKQTKTNSNLLISFLATKRTTRLGRIEQDRTEHIEEKERRETKKSQNEFLRNEKNDEKLEENKSNGKDSLDQNDLHQYDITHESSRTFRTDRTHIRTNRGKSLKKRSIESSLSNCTNESPVQNDTIRTKEQIRTNDQIRTKDSELILITLFQGKITKDNWDFFAWNFLFFVINLIHSLVLAFKLIPPRRLDKRIQSLYEQLFLPLKVTRSEFDTLIKNAEIKTLNCNDNYSVENETKINCRVSILLTGKLKVTCDDVHLHDIEANQFIDSPEFEYVSIFGDEVLRDKFDKDSVGWNEERIDDEDGEEEDNDIDAQSSKQLIRTEFETLKSSSKSNDIEMKPLKEEDEEEEDKTRLSSALGGDRRKRSSNISSQASPLINRTNVRIEFSRFSGTSSKSDQLNDGGNQATISGNQEPDQSKEKREDEYLSQVTITAYESTGDTSVEPVSYLTWNRESLINETFAQSLRLKRVFNYLIGKDITNKLQQIAVLHKENQEKAAAIISAASITNIGDNWNQGTSNRRLSMASIANTGDNWNQGTSNRKLSMASVASIAAIRSMPGSRRESGSSYRSNRSSICGGQPRSRRGSSIHGDLFWWKNQQPQSQPFHQQPQSQLFHQQPQSQLLPNNTYEVPAGHRSARRSCSIDISPLVSNTSRPGTNLTGITSGRPITPEYVTIGINKSRRASLSAGARLGVGYGSGNQIYHHPVSPGHHRPVSPGHHHPVSPGHHHPVSPGHHHPVGPIHQMTVSSPSRRGSFGGGKYVVTAAGQMSVGGNRRRSSVSTTAASVPGPLNAGQHAGSIIPALMVPSRIVDTSRKEEDMDLEEGDEHLCQGRNESTSQASSSSPRSSSALPSSAFRSSPRSSSALPSSAFRSSSSSSSSSAFRSSSTVGHSTLRSSTVIGQIQDERSQPTVLLLASGENVSNLPQIKVISASIHSQNWINELIGPNLSSADCGERDNKPSTTSYDSGNRDSGNYHSGTYDSGNYDSGNRDSGTYDSGNYDSNYANEQTTADHGSSSRIARSASMPSSSSSQVGQTVVTEQWSSSQAAGTSGSESGMRMNQEEEEEEEGEEEEEEEEGKNCFFMQLPDRFIDDDDEDGKYSDEEDPSPCMDRGRTLRSNLLL